MTAEDLLGRLAAAFDRFDPVPAPVQSTARRIRPARPARWLEPLRDSAPLVALRGPGDRVLAFAEPGARLRIEVDTELDPSGTVRLTGLCDGPAASVSVCWPGGELELPVDGHGRFAAEGLPSGPLRLAVGEPAACTPWFVG